MRKEPKHVEDMRLSQPQKSRCCINAKKSGTQQYCMYN